jgi:hypothetical protein
MQEAFGMWKLRIGALVASGAVVLGLSSGAWADGGAGEVWLGSAGEPPAHMTDTHLACQDLDLWGADLPGPSGTFTIEAWSASTNPRSYTGAWSYTQGSGRDQDQVIAVLDVPKLISQVEPNDSVHVQLDFPQHPEMDKTFSVSCSSGSADGGQSGSMGDGQSGGGTGSPCHSGGGDTTGGGGGTTSGGGSTTPGGSPTSADDAPTGTITTPSVTTTSTGSVKTSIGAVTASRHKAHKAHKARKRRKLVRSKRDRKIHKRRVKAVTVRVPTFTG